MLTMKIFVSVVVCAVSGFGFVGCGSTQERSAEPMIAGAGDGAVGAKMRVDGLGCPMCSESITILLEQVDGVRDSRVDLSNGVVSVDLDPSVAVSDAALRAAVDDGGFTFRSIEYIK